MLRLFTAFACALLLINTAIAEPTNLGLLKKELRQYHDNGTYEKELNASIDEAHRYIIRQAEKNRQLPAPKKLAVVLDIDETSLSNYDKFSKHDFSPTAAQIHHDIQQADSPAIKAMLDLYNDARKHGVSVFFVTGRPITDLDVTKTNLQNDGYHDWAGLYLRPENDKRRSIVYFKSQTRAMINKQGYTIVASIGDQYSDLLGGHAKRAFKLPNPWYFLP